MNLLVMGERIKKLREEQGWTQQDLARRIGASRVTVVSWEKGERAPKGFIQELAKVFNVSPLYITGEIDDRVATTERTDDLYEMLDRATYYRGRFLSAKEISALKGVIEVMLNKNEP